MHGVGARFSQCDATWTQRGGAATGATGAGNDVGVPAAPGLLVQLLPPELPVATVYSQRLAHPETSAANPAWPVGEEPSVTGSPVHTGRLQCDGRPSQCL